MKTSLKTFSLCLSLAALSGCATTQITNHQANTAQPINAQDALGNAIQSQLRTSFGYRTDIAVTNAMQRDALATAGTTTDATNCEQVHDTAYIAWLKQLQAAGVDIENLDASAYQDKLDAFKAQFNECQTQAEAAEFDTDGFFEKNTQLPIDAQFDQFFDTYQAHSEQPAAKSSTLDAKKAALTDAYLIKPSRIEVMGNYQPLAGHITILPIAEYQSKNLQARITQPMYFDLKKGDLYLWADHLALINSQALDKELGTAWHNKWLKIPLNDDSLPKDFYKKFLQGLLDAKKQSFYSLDTSLFTWTNADSLINLPHLREQLTDAQLQIITGSDRIIRAQPSMQAKNFADYIFADTLYNAIIEAIPEYQAVFMPPERTIEEGESRIIINQITGEPPTDITADEEVKLNSRTMIHVLLSYLAQVMDGYMASTQNQTQSESSAYAPVSHYGLQGKGLQWMHQRYYLGDQTQTSSTPLVVDSFTTITPVMHDTFVRLPSAHRMPNDANSINLFEYGNDLFARLKEGDNRYLKAMIAMTTGIGAAADDGADYELPYDEMEVVPDEPDLDDAPDAP